MLLSFHLPLFTLFITKGIPFINPYTDVLGNYFLAVFPEFSYLVLYPLKTAGTRNLKSRELEKLLEQPKIAVYSTVLLQLFATQITSFESNKPISFTMSHLN